MKDRGIPICVYFDQTFQGWLWKAGAILGCPRAVISQKFSSKRVEKFQLKNSICNLEFFFWKVFR